MLRKISSGLAIAGAAAVLVVPATPAAAATSQYDCTILGPAYVQEVVACAFYILEHLA